MKSYPEPLTVPEGQNKLRTIAETILLNMMTAPEPREGWTKTDLVHYLEQCAREEAVLAGDVNHWIFYLPYAYIKEQALMH